MEKRTRRKYSPEFKREAVALANNPGQKIAGIAKDLGIRENLLRRWKYEIEQHGQLAFGGQGVARDEELMRLRRELAQVKKERNFFKKRGGGLRQGRKMKCQCIAADRDNVPVARMCRLLGVNTSGFYAWACRPASERSLLNDRLKKKIVEIHAESDGAYGSPNVRDELFNLRFLAGKHRVARLMRELGLKGSPKKRYRVTTDSGHGFRTAPNTLDRQFTANGPNQRWASDITYISTGEGWLYLADVMDL